MTYPQRVGGEVGVMPPTSDDDALAWIECARRYLTTERESALGLGLDPVELARNALAKAQGELTEEWGA